MGNWTYLVCILSKSWFQKLYCDVFCIPTVQKNLKLQIVYTMSIGNHESCLNISPDVIKINPPTGKMGYVSEHSLEEQHEVFLSVRLISLMTIKLSSVSCRVTTPQLSILTPVSRNKIRPEEDSHLMTLSSKKKRKNN